MSDPNTNPYNTTLIVRTANHKMADSACQEYWKNSFQLYPNIAMSGYSRAAEATGFILQGLGIALDAGVETKEHPEIILLTHLHLDHMINLCRMLIDNPNNPIIIIPNNDKFELLLRGYLAFAYMSSQVSSIRSVQRDKNRLVSIRTESLSWTLANRLNYRSS